MASIQNRHFSTDDSIIISSTTDKAEIDPVFDYKAHMLRGDITSYYRKLGNNVEYFSKDTGLEEVKRLNLKPIHEYKTCLNWNNYYVRDNAELELRIHSLYVDLFQSRYYKVNQSLIELHKRGFLLNNSSKDLDSQDFAKYTRNRLLRARNVTKQWVEKGELVTRKVPEFDWNVKSYDWNIVISDSDFALKLHNRLKEAEYNFEQPYADCSEAGGIYNTVYVKGYHSQNKSILIRCYDTYHTSTPDFHQLKIEISFRKDWLRGAGSKRPNLRQVSHFTTQSDILNILRTAIKQQLKHVFKVAGYDVNNPTDNQRVKELMDFVGVSNKTKIFDKMLEPQFCLSSIVKRLEGSYSKKQIDEYKELMTNSRLDLREELKINMNVGLEEKSQDFTKWYEYNRDLYIQQKKWGELESYLYDEKYLKPEEFKKAHPVHVLNRKRRW